MTARRPKGAGTIERTAAGLYRARFPFEPGKREDVGTFATHADAERTLDAILATLHDGGAARGFTLRMLGRHVLDEREREGVRSIKDDRNRWKSYVETWELVDAAVKTITRADVRTWLGRLARRGLAVQTRRNALNLLRVAFRHAVEMDLIEANPCAEIRVRDTGSTAEKSTHLTASEAAALIEASRAPEVAIAIYTGLRSGELRSLRWEDVHESHITVRFGSPGRPTKNGKIRNVPLIPGVREIFATVERRGGGLVFPGLEGGARKRGQMVPIADWRAWLSAAGISRRVRWHDLRHTCATLLLQGAFGRPWSLEEVKEALGHSSIRVTERYAKATGTLAERAAREMHASAQAQNKPDVECKHSPENVSDIAEVRTGFEPAYDGFANRPTSNDLAAIGALSGLARAYLIAMANGAPETHRLGAELAAAVLSAAPARLVVAS